MSENTHVFCGQCGQPNPGENKFCGHCGAKLQPITAADPAQEFEYKTLKVDADVGRDFGRVLARTGIAWEQLSALTEQAARVHFWQVDQRRIYALLEQEAKYGWRPFTEVGPGCIKVKDSMAQQSGGAIFNHVIARFIMPEWCYVGFEIGLRRAVKRSS